jgi:TonB family protein
VQFKFLMRSSTETRFEQRGELAPAVIVCNGSNAWVYSPPLHRYRKEPSAGNKLCSLIAEDWKVLPISLESPVLAGLCGLEPSTPSLGYKLVRGFSEPERISSDRIRRTLCIDPKRKLIVWEKFESQYTRVYTYSTNDQNVELAYEAFVFEPPPDGEPTDFELPTPRPLGRRGMLYGPGISSPRIKSKKEPKYGEASRQAGIEGGVILYVVIGADGIPLDVLVYRQLSPDLDAEAVSAVRQWRFTPAKSNGQPVALPAMVEVSFRLH